MSKGRGKCSDGVILEGVLDLLGVKMGGGVFYFVS